MDEPEIKTPVEARQGDRRRMNLRVLLISCALIVVFFGLLFMIGYSPMA